MPLTSKRVSAVELHLCKSFPFSKTVREKLTKAGIGFQLLTIVFSIYGSKGLLALLSMPAPTSSTNLKVLQSINANETLE